jgi:hypothetical protein
MSIPDFTVKSGPVPKKTRPAASFNMSGDGPLINSASPAPSKPVAPSTARQQAPQTRSPAANVNQAQFKGSAPKPNSPYVGKRRAPAGKHAAPSTDTGYRGPRAKGAHAQDYNMQSDLDKSRATSQYTGQHSARAPKPIGKHGRPYNANKDINRDLADKKAGKAPYVPKHTPQGQATRAQAAKVAQRQQNAANAYGKAKSVQHALHVFQRHFSGKHYTEHLRAMETRI